MEGKEISVREFKTLWDWCSEKKNNDEFWHRFTCAITAYDMDTRLRLMKFVIFMNTP